MFDIKNLMAQAGAIQEKIQTEQAKLASNEYVGKAGGHLVSIILSGKGEMLSVQIDASLFKKEEKEVMEDLIIAAYNEARHKMDSATTSLMSGMMGGMSLPPGFKLPF